MDLSIIFSQPHPCSKFQVVSDFSMRGYNTAKSQLDFSTLIYNATKTVLMVGQKLVNTMFSWAGV